MLALGRARRLLEPGALALVGALTCQPGAAGEVYQWQDASGRTVFSQQAPTGTKALKIQKQGGKPVSAASPTPATAPQASTAAVKPPPPAPLSEEDKAKLARGCEQAQTALKLLRENSRPRYIDEQGQRVYMTEAMKAERTADAERKAADYCREP